LNAPCPEFFDFGLLATEEGLWLYAMKRAHVIVINFFFAIVATLRGKGLFLAGF